MRNIVFIKEQSKVNDLLPLLMQKPAWGLDVESNGSCPHQNNVTMMQIGRPDIQYVIDVRVVTPEPLRPFLESEEHMKIAHMSKFEYKMIKGSFGIDTEQLRCTFNAEKIIHNGRRHYFYKSSLDDVLIDRLGVICPYDKKKMQKSFLDHSGEFTESQIGYGGWDVEHLVDLYKDQCKDLKQGGLVNTFLLESDAMYAFGDMEFYGMNLNKEKWLDVKNGNISRMKELGENMDSFALQFVDRNLFDEPNINYGSPKQMLDLLQRMGFKVPDYDYKTKTETWKLIKESNDKTLAKISDKPFIKLIREYRTLQKYVQTYGDSFIDAINPVTGRIHPNYWQLGAESGRPTSGDSDVNMLNIPKDNRFRSCFEAADGYVIETDDFVSCEPRIQAALSGDPAMFEVFTKDIDYHCYASSKIFETVVEKNGKNSQLRAPGKECNLGISYGIGPGSIYYKLRELDFKYDRDEVYKMYWKYKKNVFPVAINYIQNRGKEASREGVLKSITGRRRFFKTKDDMNWKERGAIERSGGNFDFQSISADITKRAMSDIRKHIKKNNVRSKIVHAVYDEVVTETHEGDSKDFHTEKMKIMSNAAKKIITAVPMPIEGFVGKSWRK